MEISSFGIKHVRPSPAQTTLISTSTFKIAINWSECTESVETPLTRLSELFNVNHFIVSQANPILAPFIAPTAEARPCLSYIYSLITSEITHRLRQLDYLGLLPRFIKYFIEDRVSGNVTIVPSLTTHVCFESLVT